MFVGWFVCLFVTDKLGAVGCHTLGPTYETHILNHHDPSSDILVLKLISVLVFILFSSQNFYFIQF